MGLSRKLPCYLLLAGIILVLSSISNIAYAHGGGLNKQGCHNNRKTGDYHCHRKPSGQSQKKQQKRSSDSNYAKALQDAKTEIIALQNTLQNAKTEIRRLNKLLQDANNEINELNKQLQGRLAYHGTVLNVSDTPRYNRQDWQFRSYKSDTNIGFYTLQICDKIDIDHLVSLYDAHQSGGYQWQGEQKRIFANDTHNHKPACASINRSKGNTTPALFFNRAKDGKGLDYHIITKCQYLDIYKQIKQKYQLSFNNNQHDVLTFCS